MSNMATLVRSILILLLCSMVVADDIEIEVRSGTVLKMLREMVNQTKGDSLNLPANATSIRENITDTFSCENRTYGYYADVDNDCQLFHVCLPSQTTSGRNITYKWSFICPAETVFNQEVLVCTRPRDSIPCEDSPSYYDLNMEIGKIAEKPEKEETPPTNKLTETVNIKNQKRQNNRKKQNIIAEALMQEVIEDIKANDEEKIETELPEAETLNIVPVIVDDEVVTKEEKDFDMAPMALEDTRLGTERSMRRGRRINRGNLKYRSDVW